MSLKDLFGKKESNEETSTVETTKESILTTEELAELNPEGVEINTVIDDTTIQDTFNTDPIDELTDGEAEIEHVEDAAVEGAE